MWNFAEPVLRKTMENLIYGRTRPPLNPDLQEAVRNIRDVRLPIRLSRTSSAPLPPPPPSLCVCTDTNAMPARRCDI